MSINVSNSSTLVENLWNHEVNADNYGSKEQYQNHLLEQYKIYVEMTDQISNRRNLANTFFLTLHTLIIASVGFLYEKLPYFTYRWIVILPLVAVLLLCYVWWRLIIAYKQLNTAKFLVINEYEKRLPTRPFVAAEWRALGEGKNPKVYKSLSDIEKWIPLIFACLYFLGVGLFIFLK